MKMETLKNELLRIKAKPQTVRTLVKEAIEHAGSIGKLSVKTGLRRQSIKLWAIGAVLPTDETLTTLITWLSDEVAKEKSDET